MTDFNLGSEPEARELATTIEINTINKMGRRVKVLEGELAACREAMDILEKNPDINRLLTLMGKIRL